MKIYRADPAQEKGWYAGPWNSTLALSIGYANRGVDEPHQHARTTEIYLVARGTACMRIEGQTLTLQPGDVLLVEPGEAHTFLESSPDYFHFVLHTPGLQGEEARADKIVVPRYRLE